MIGDENEKLEQRNVLSLNYDSDGLVKVFLPYFPNFSHIKIVVQIVDNDFGTIQYQLTDEIHIMQNINKTNEITNDLIDLEKFNSSFVASFQTVEINEMAHNAISYVSLLNNIENTTRENDNIYAIVKQRMIVEIYKLNTSHINSVKLIASIFSVMSHKSEQLSRYSSVFIFIYLIFSIFNK